MSEEGLNPARVEPATKSKAGNVAANPMYFARGRMHLRFTSVYGKIQMKTLACQPFA